MTRATVTVEYVNMPKPGKKKGSIKTKELEYIGAWPEELANFKEGGTYDIEYSDSDFKGKTYHNLEALLADVSAAHPTPAQSHSSGSDISVKEKAMFLMSVVGRGMGSGAFTDTDAVVALTRKASEVWDEVMK